MGVNSRLGFRSGQDPREERQGWGRAQGAALFGPDSPFTAP